MSLHEIAPRLAAARDVERWNIWCAGDEGVGDQSIRDGDRWAETLSASHDTALHATCAGLRDKRCGGIVDHYVITQRLLYGVNRGRVSLIEAWKCRACRASRSSHR